MRLDPVDHPENKTRAEVAEPSVQNLKLCNLAV